MTDTPLHTSSEKAQEFFAMMGFCLTEWARVDDTLFEIFHSCVGYRKQCSIIYYRMPGLDPRFNATNEVVLSILPQRARGDGGHDDGAVKEWKATIKGWEGLLATRRRIAHHPITFKVSNGSLGYGSGGGYNVAGAIASPLNFSFELYVSNNEALRKNREQDPTINIETLKKHAIDVGQLSDRLRNFLINELKKHVPSKVADII